MCMDRWRLRESSCSIANAIMWRRKRSLCFVRKVSGDRRSRKGRFLARGDVSSCSGLITLFLGFLLFSAFHGNAVLTHLFGTFLFLIFGAVIFITV